MPNTKNFLTQALDPDTLNVAELVDDDLLAKIGMEIVQLYTADLESRSDWERKATRAMALAKQIYEEKTFPTGEKSSSIKYPILTESAIQFASRAYPELLKGNDIVKAEVTGKDDELGTKEARATRISMHMGWQLTKQMDGWLSDMDFALHAHPIVGGFAKKTYFDPGKGRNISDVVQLLDYVVNQSADRYQLRRESHRYWYYKNDLLEKMRSGLWKEYDNLGSGSKEEDQGEEDAGHEIIEQHCFYDLDGDEYKEPWVITVHKDTGKVLRIAPRFEEKGIKKNKKGDIYRIEPNSYFTMYRFFPDPAGGFYPLGLGHLLTDMNEAINTIINQLIDAGTLGVRAGGLIARGLKLKGNQKDISPFKWQFVNIEAAKLRDAVFPFPVREPSAVLFSLLGLLIDAARGVANLKEVLSGETKTLGKDLSPTTYMGLVEQGLKVFIGIYKRFYDALTEEFRKLYRLNAIYLEPEESFMVSGEQQTVALSDYQQDDLEVVPVADPNLATDLLRRAQDQALLMLSGRPGINELEVTRRAVKSLHTGADEKILLTDEQVKNPQQMPYPVKPDPRTIIAQAKMQEQQAKTMEAGMRFKMDAARFELELKEMESRISNLEADTMLKLAKAQSEGDEDRLKEYKTMLDQLNGEVKMQIEMARQMSQAMQGGGQPQQQPGQQPGQQQPQSQQQPGGQPSGQPGQIAAG